MSRLIGIPTAALLFAIGLLHVYWAAGGKWGTEVTVPKQDGKALFQPAPAGTLLVAILLVSAGLVVLGRLGLWGTALPRWVFVAGTWTLVAVFLGRVVGDFRWFGLFKRRRGTAFAWWDTWLYVDRLAQQLQVDACNKSSSSGGQVIDTDPPPAARSQRREGPYESR